MVRLRDEVLGLAADEVVEEGGFAHATFANDVDGAEFGEFTGDETEGGLAAKDGLAGAQGPPDDEGGTGGGFEGGGRAWECGGVVNGGRGCGERGSVEVDAAFDAGAVAEYADVLCTYVVHHLDPPDCAAI
jgi:hypothetical protein